jgi:hypothetical protein
MHKLYKFSEGMSGVIEEGKEELGICDNKYGFADYEVEQIHFSYLGLVSYPSSLNYIDNGLLYIASAMGPSLLVKILDKLSHDQNNPFIKVLQTFENLAPVTDFAVVDLNMQGKLLYSSPF